MIRSITVATMLAAFASLSLAGCLTDDDDVTTEQRQEPGENDGEGSPDDQCASLDDNEGPCEVPE